MLEKIVSLVVIIAGTYAIIKYLVPFLGAFAGLATILIALLGIIIAVGILAGYDWRSVIK